MSAVDEAILPAKRLQLGRASPKVGSRLRQIAVEEAADPGSRKRSFAKRDLSVLLSSTCPCETEQLGTTFGKAGAANDRRRGLSANCPATGFQNGETGSRHEAVAKIYARAMLSI